MRHIAWTGLRLLAVAAMAATLGCNGRGDGDVGQSAHELVGTWTGYIENFTFPSGSDAIAITRTAQGSGYVGSVAFGSAPSPAPPSDPDVGYPPGYDFSMLGGGMAPVEGFPFTLLDEAVSQPRIQFKAEPRELWKAWCELQTPVSWAPNAPSMYGCLPNCGTYYSDTSCKLVCETGETPVDCGKLGLCNMGMTCSCTATACTVEMYGALSFDLFVDGEYAHGSVLGLPDGLRNVHLQRTP
jgi:hypothetical protein